MKRSVSVLFVIMAMSLFALAQQKPAPIQFTKEEVLAFTDLRQLLSDMKQGKDYSKYFIRNFSLSTVVSNTDSTQIKISETGPGGTINEKQKKLLQNYGKKGAVFTLENILMAEPGKKGMADEPAISFSIK